MSEKFKKYKRKTIKNNKIEEIGFFDDENAKNDNLNNANGKIDRRKGEKKNKKITSKISFAKSKSQSEQEGQEELQVSKDNLIVEKQVARHKKRRKKPNRILKFASKFGMSKIEVKGENAHRVLINLSSVAHLEKIEKYNDKICFLVSSKHCDKIVAILRKLCYDYKIIEIIGAVPSFARTLIRVGITLGLVACIVALGVYPHFVTKISIVASDTSQIESVLKDYGVEIGAFLPKLDTTAIQNSLLQLDGIAFGQVTKNGAHVEVYVKQELPNENLVDVKSQPVVSKKRATITRVIVRGGTAVVKYGDVVEAGDSIVEGYVCYGDDMIDTPASGEAYGRVYYQKSMFFADEYFEKTYTQTTVKTVISFFGKTPKTPKSPYDTYECATSVEKYAFLLPFEIYRYEFRQLVVTKKQNDLNEDAMKKKVYASVLEELENPATIESVYWDIQRLDDGTRVSVTVQAEEKIT